MPHLYGGLAPSSRNTGPEPTAEHAHATDRPANASPMRATLPNVLRSQPVTIAELSIHHGSAVDAVRFMLFVMAVCPEVVSQRRHGVLDPRVGGAVAIITAGRAFFGYRVQHGSEVLPPSRVLR